MKYKVVIETAAPINNCDFCKFNKDGRCSFSGLLIGGWCPLIPVTASEKDSIEKLRKLYEKKLPKMRTDYDEGYLEALEYVLGMMDEDFENQEDGEKQLTLF